jgi:cellulose biosynthesis protein BcsQ
MNTDDTLHSAGIGTTFGFKINKFIYFCSKLTCMPPTLIAVHTMKGGSGKSTITTILASYLRYVKQKRVLVVDADDPQYSISSIRENELSLYERLVKLTRSGHSPTALSAMANTPFEKAMTERLRFNSEHQITPDDFYPVLRATAATLRQVDFSADIGFDYVFLDLGGVYDQHIVTMLAKCQLVLIPFTTQNIDIRHSTDYCLMLIDSIQEGTLGQTTQIRCLWNKYKFFYDKKAQLIEETIGNYFTEINTPVAFMKARLQDADAGFDQNKMLTTLSNPVAIEGGKYAGTVVQLADELVSICEPSVATQTA